MMTVYRPVAGPALISGDRASHAEYGVGSATDYAVAVGTTIVAPIAGTISRYWSGSGGNTVVVDGDGWTGFGQHLSAYLGDTDSVAARSSIGRSGNTGSDSTGPHLHWWWIQDGTLDRYSMEEFIGLMGGTPVDIDHYTPSGLSPAGGGAIPFPIVPTPSKGNDMSVIYHKITSIGKPFTVYALAGSSPGTPANWHETTSVDLANQWAKQMGSTAAPNAVNGFSAGVNDATWDQYKSDYLAPLSIKAK